MATAQTTREIPAWWLLTALAGAFALPGCVMGDLAPSLAHIASQAGQLCFTLSPQSIPNPENTRLDVVAVYDAQKELWVYWEKDTARQQLASRACVPYGARAAKDDRNSTSALSIPPLQEGRTYRVNVGAIDPTTSGGARRPSGHAYFCFVRTPQGELHVVQAGQPVQCPIK